MTTAHTPGTWHSSGCEVYTSEGPICHIEPGPHADANARLIAESPETLDALREVTSLLKLLAAPDDRMAQDIIYRADVSMMRATGE